MSCRRDCGLYNVFAEDPCRISRVRSYFVFVGERSISPPSEGHVASKALEWLDVGVCKFVFSIEDVGDHASERKTNESRYDVRGVHSLRKTGRSRYSIPSRGSADSGCMPFISMSRKWITLGKAE